MSSEVPNRSSISDIVSSGRDSGWQLILKPCSAPMNAAGTRLRRTCCDVITSTIDGVLIDDLAGASFDATRSLAPCYKAAALNE